MSPTYRTALAQLFVHGHLQVRENRGSSPSGHPASPDRPPGPPGQTGPPALAEAPERQDHLEAIFASSWRPPRIQPGRNPNADMDLRRDLSVRSRPSSDPSWMPQNATSGSPIELEDFIHVRTVRDIARKISMIARPAGRLRRSGSRCQDGGPPAAARNGAPEAVRRGRRG